MRNASFQDIEKTAQANGYGAFANAPFTGKAIQAADGSLDVRGNIISAGHPVVFNDCHTGVQTTNTGVQLWECVMLGVANGIIANGGISKPYYIAWNNITASDKGISTFYQSGLSGQSNIEYNTVRMVGNAKGIGIGVGGQEMFPQYEGFLLGNTVTMDDGGAGIHVGVANRLRATRNYVHLNGTTVPYGIRMEGGDRNTLNCNSVTNPGSGDNAALYAVHPARASILCNTADGTARGLHFEGMLAGKAKASKAKNTMKNNAANGLLLGMDAVIGEQRHTGNKWEGGLTSAQHLSPFISNFSQFIVDGNENADFLPDLVDPLDWFIDESTPQPTDSECVPGTACPLQTLITPDIVLERKIAKSELGGSEYAVPQQWLAQRRLYETLTEDGNPYSTDVDFINFLTQAESNGIAQYANLQMGIMQLGSLSSEDRLVAAAALLSANNNLTGSAAYQANEKAVNSIFLSTVALGYLTLSEAQAGGLRTIANSCPLSDGEAVLRARAMLHLLDEEPANYDDNELCYLSQPREGRSTVGSKSQSIRLYSNPANNEITIEYRLSEFADNRLLIFNVFGQTVREVNLPDANGTLSIPTSDLSEGIYWYAVQGAFNPALSGKIIINH